MNSVMILCIVVTVVGAVIMIYTVGKSNERKDQENKNLNDALKLKTKQDEVKKNLDIELIDKRKRIRDILREINSSD